MSLRGGNALSYAQYHTLEAGMTSEAILRSFGTPADTLEQDGAIRGLTYRCENATGRVQELRMVFDAGGTLERWALRGSSGKDAAKTDGAAPDTD